MKNPSKQTVWYCLAIVACPLFGLAVLSGSSPKGIEQVILKCVAMISFSICESASIIGAIIVVHKEMLETNEQEGSLDDYAGRESNAAKTTTTDKPDLGQTPK